MDLTGFGIAGIQYSQNLTFNKYKETYSEKIPVSFNINDMKSSLRYGGARGTLFQVQFFNPVNGTATLDIPVKVRAASLPESQLGVIPVFYFGRAIKYAGDRQFAPWQVTVINDEDFLIRNSLEEWSNAINALERNIRDLPGSEASLYKSNATVLQYSKTGEVLREYTFRGIWPSAITPIDLDWGGQDTIEEFQVQFEYDNYEVTGGITGNAGGA